MENIPFFDLSPRDWVTGGTGGEGVKFTCVCCTCHILFLASFQVPTFIHSIKARQVLVTMLIHLFTFFTALGTAGMNWRSFPAITGIKMANVSLIKTFSTSNCPSAEMGWVSGYWEKRERVAGLGHIIRNPGSLMLKCLLLTTVLHKITWIILHFMSGIVRI